MTNLTAKKEYEPFLLPSHVRNQIRTTQHFKDFIYQWNHGTYNNAEDVGELMAALKTLLPMNPKATLEDWHAFYFENIKSYEDIVAHVKRINDETKLGSYVLAVNYFHIHILDCAYEGMLGELLAKQKIEEYIASKEDNSLRVQFASPEEDRKYGVDLIVTRNGTPIIGVQVKRSSYFTSTRETVVKAREGYNPRKYKAFKENTGADVWYLDCERLELTGELNKNTWWKALKD